MQVHRLQTELWLPQARARVFTFFADPTNLQRLTPQWLHFRLLTPQPVQMRDGILLDYRLRIHGLPVWWQSQITEWNPPYGFVDRQTRGPYRLWVHEHTFTEERDGTIVRDHVRYSARGGALVHRFLVAPDLERIFGYRQRVLRDLFNPEGKSPASAQR